jgi:hypothetical protein
MSKFIILIYGFYGVTPFVPILRRQRKCQSYMKWINSNLYTLTKHYMTVEFEIFTPVDSNRPTGRQPG